MIVYELKAEGPLSVSYVMKVAELGHGEVSLRRGVPHVPGTQLYGAFMAATRKRERGLEGAFKLLEEPLEGLFYPALPKAGGAVGVFKCEKSACTYVDFASLSAYRGPQRPIKQSRHVHVSLYIDRGSRAGRHGALYSYPVWQVEEGFVTAIDCEKCPRGERRLRLGYKKGLGLGEVRAVPLEPSMPVTSYKFLLLAPAPLSLFKGAKFNRLEVRFSPVHYVYVQALNKFYFVGERFGEPYLSPGTVVEVERRTTAVALWRELAARLDGLKVFRWDGREEGLDVVKKFVLAKAKATMAAPVAYVEA